MKKLSFFLCFVSILALWFGGAVPVLAAPHAAPASLSGVVRDGSGQGYPLYAQISVSGATTQVVYSNPLTGAYTIEGLDSSQSYTFTIKAVLTGYQTLVDGVSLLPGINTRDYTLFVNAVDCNAPGYARAVVWGSNFESDGGGFAGSGQNNSWQWGGPTTGPGYAHSGSKVWATNLTGNYSNDESSYLTRDAALNLSGRHGLRVSWWQWLQTYDDFDYVILQISRDNGASWVNVYGSEYPWGTTTKGTVYGNVDLAWAEHTLDLDSSYAVGQVKLRLRFKSDWNLFGTSQPGWYVDDFQITACQAVNGGLVAGHVRDANSNVPLNGATVQQDGYASSVISYATPTDPGLDDGFYQLFVYGTTQASLEAEKQHYATSWFLVTPQHAAVVGRDLLLPPNYDLESSANPLSLAAEPGQVVTYTVSLTNTGALPGELLSNLQTIPTAPQWQTVIAPPLTAVVPPGETAQVTVQVTIPPFTPAGTQDVIALHSHWVGTLQWVLPPASRTITLTTVVLNAVPQVQPQTLTTAEDTPVDLTLTALDINGDVLTLEYTQPTHGSLSGSVPNLTYSPMPDYNGSDSFTFTASDGSLVSPPAEVSITVTPVNDPPTASGQALTLNEDVPQAITLLALDVDGDPLTWTVNDPAHGTLSGTAPNLTYTPTLNFYGADSFTCFVSDGEFSSDPVTVHLTVAPVNDAPTVEAQTLTLEEDTPLAITLVAADVEGDPLTWTVNDPAHGTLSGTAPNLTYTPALNFYGADSFTVTVNDGNADSTPATIVLTVTPVNDAPQAVADAYAMLEDRALNVLSAQGLLANDADVEGDLLTVALESAPAQGELVLQSDGSFRYTPPPNFYGLVTFSYRAWDGELSSPIVSVTITVTDGVESLYLPAIAR